MSFDPDDPFGPPRAVPPPNTPPPAGPSAGPNEPDETVRLPSTPSRAGRFGGFSFDDLPPAADLYVPQSAPRPPAQDGDTVRLGGTRSADPDATIRIAAHRPSADAAPSATPSAPPAAASGRAAEPVVGWLVVAGGPARGRDFRLLAGRTTIGREASNGVVLGFDTHVSRERHAVVSYDPRANAFHLLPGDGSGLVYLNGAAVYAPAPLAAHDRVELGQTTLVFVPLCAEAFQWTAP